MKTNAQPERMYHLQAVNSRTNRTVRLTGYPMTHAQCCTMKSKFSYHKERHIELIEHRDGAA